MIYIGIDPGASGAIAVIYDDVINFYDLSKSHADNVDHLKAILFSGKVERSALFAVIEKVNAMPKQGVASSFNFGVTFGALQGALYALNIPFTLVTPQKWKARVFDSSPRGQVKADQKTAARDLARRLYPQASDRLARVKDSDRAEALLMAHYAMLNMKGE